MRQGLTTLVNPATSVKAPQPTADARFLARHAGSLQTDLAHAAARGHGNQVATLSAKLTDTRADLYRIAHDDGATPASRETARRALAR